MYKRQIPIEHIPANKYADKPGLDLAEQLEASIEEVTQRKCERKNVADKIVFRINEWNEIAVKWPDGRDLEGQYGPSVMFTTMDERVFFVPPVAGAKIRALKLAPGDYINVRKAEVNGANGSRPHLEWQVERVSPAGQQANGTMVIPKEKQAASASPEVSAAQTSVATPTTEPRSASVNTKSITTHDNTASPFQHSGSAGLLRDTTNMLVDVLANCKNYASRYNGLLSADDVRSIMLSAYINMSKASKQ